MSNKPKWMKSKYWKRNNMKIENPNHDEEVMVQHESSDGTYIELENEDGTMEKVFVDEIIAKMFIPRPNYDGELKVLHLNGNINDNAVTNLAWCRPDDPRYLKMISKTQSVD